MRKATYVPNKSQNFQGKDKSALNQGPQNININQEKKEELSDTPTGIGLLVKALVKAITDSIKEVIEAMNKNNERLIKVLTSGNINRIRINDSQNNNNMDNNIEEDSKVNNNNNNMLNAKKNENIKFEDSHNANNDNIESNNTFTNMNLNSSDIIEGNNIINDPSTFSIKSKSLIKKNDSSSNNNNSSSNNNHINIKEEMNSSDTSVPKRNALIKNKKKEDSLKINQNTDFNNYKSSLAPKDQKKKKKPINPFLPNYYNEKKKSYSFMGNKIA